MALVPADAAPFRTVAVGRLGHEQSVPSVEEPLAALGALEGRPVSKVACGPYHAAVVVPGNPAAVLTWGRGALGPLGHGDEADVAEPRPVDALLRGGVAVRSVACGPYQTAVVSAAGEVFAWGWCFEDGPAGGIQEGYTATPVPVRGLADVRVRAVACGTYCAAALTVDGGLYTWGKGTRGQLGHGNARDVVRPARVAALRHVFVWDAAFGKAFLLTLTSDGSVYANGGSDGGALGLGAAVREEHTPRQLRALRGRVAQAIACGDAHCAALLERGEVWCWGSAQHGRLGDADATGRPPQDAAEPQRVEAMAGRSCVAVACGAYSTAVLLDSGHLWRWGGRGLAMNPPSRLRLGGSACAVAAAGGHALAVLGEALPDAAELALARQVGFVLPASRAALSDGVLSELGPLSRLVEQPPPPDADPAAVLQQLNALRGALAQAEARKEAVTNELADLQGELQRAMLEQEILRETRGGDEPPPEPPITKGVAVVDPMTYDAMLPEEQAELQIFGFKMSFATTTKK